MTLESQIIKTTDPALTNDNWQFILDVCDTISLDPETNIRAAMKIVRARLAQKDANIVLRTLTLLVAMGENCGSRMQQEIASSSFLKECLLARLADRKVHREVKFRVAEVIEQLDKSFKKDPSLKAIADAYSTVQSKYSQYLKSPPSKPAKTEMTAQDRRNEDLELERALGLSVQEYEREQSVRRSYLESKPLPAPLQGGNSGSRHENTTFGGQSNLQSFQSNSQPNTQHHGQAREDSNGGPVAKNGPDTVTIASVKKVVALYDLISYEPEELSFRKGDIITVIESVYRDWWRGSLPTGKVGIFPLNYVTPVVSKTPEELARESKLENALVDTESRKVDRLLALLSMDPNSVSEEEVTDLYNSIVPLKSVLGQLITKHSARRDELRALNDQVNTETKLYNDSIDTMIAQRQNTQSAYSLPYPAQPQSQYISQQQQMQVPQPQITGPSPSQSVGQAQQFSGYGNYLEQQPTSAGFGNGVSYGGGRPLEYTATGQSQASGVYPPQTSFPSRPEY